MKNKKSKLIFASFVLLILIINFIVILDADYIDDILEKVNNENWKGVVKHYIKNPRPQNDNPKVINRLWQQSYVDDKLILDAWKDLDSPDKFSERNYRYELWKTLDDENRKKLLTSFSSEKDSEGKNLKELWDSSDNKQSYERQTQKNKLLSLLSTDKKNILIQEVTKKEIDLPKDTENKLDITYDEEENGFKKFEIADPNKNKHIIPINNLPSELKKIEFAKSNDNKKYHTFYYFDGKQEKTALLDAGKYLQTKNEGYNSKEEIIVKGYNTKFDPIISFGESEKAIIKISESKIELWDKDADITGKKANVQIGDETIFAHPKVLTKDQKYSYASYEKSFLSDDVFHIRGAGRTSRNGGLGFYFENEGVLDLDGEYDIRENKPILKFYKKGDNLIISGQTPSINNPVTFTLGKDANLIVGDKGLKLEAKDKEKNYYQYAIIGNKVSQNNPVNEYVPRLTPIKYLTNSEERISNGEDTADRTSVVVQQAISQSEKAISTPPTFSVITEKSVVTDNNFEKIILDGKQVFAIKTGDNTYMVRGNVGNNIYKIDSDSRIVTHVLVTKHICNASGCKKEYTWKPVN